MSKDLTQDRARVFRITHRDNLSWILRHGIHSANTPIRDPDFVPIGHPDIISKRNHRVVPAPYGGTLSDYVPFYFTPFSPMMYNIHTGWNGLRRRSNEEILVLVTSVHKLAESGVQVVFSDRHALTAYARFYSDPARLDVIDWPILQRRDFRRDQNDLGKVERYEAECLARTHVPVAALLGIACADESAKAHANAAVEATGVATDVRVLPQWYFG